jgi:hypothetical protein
MTTPILLPPLPEPEYATWQYNQHGHAVLEKTEAYTADQLRARDLEVARCVLEAIAAWLEPDVYGGYLVDEIRNLEIKHHE